MDNCSLYFLDKGTLEYTISQNQEFQSLRKLKKGDLFGLRSFLTDESRETSVRCKTFATVLELRKTDFLSILKKYQKDFVF